jgi:hypothetical protein
MDNNEPVVIRTTNSLAEAEVLKNVLEREGIKCELGGEMQGGLPGVVGVPVLVRAWDEHKAREILAKHGHGGK